MNSQHRQTVAAVNGSANADEQRFGAALDAADKALGEITGLAFLGTARETEAEVSEELVTRLWGHLTTTICTLAALHEDTPRTIASDVFKHLPEDEQHRADIEERVERLRRRL